MKHSSTVGASARLAARWAAAACMAVHASTWAAPQLMLVNAKVFTADAAQPYAQAVAIQDGLILAVGRDIDIRALAGPQTRIIDVGGRLVTPGLVEAHVHLGQELPTPPLPMPNMLFPGPTPEQALAGVEQAVRAREAARKDGGKDGDRDDRDNDWLCAYIGPLVARDPRNWRAALDAVAPHTPVFLRGPWGHTSIVNSEGLRRLGIAEGVADPLGGWWGRDAQGRLDGRAYEAAETMGPRIRPAEPQRLAEALGKAAQRYARWGVTSIHLMNNDKSLPVTLSALALLAAAPNAPPLQKWTVYAWGAWETPANDIPRAWAAIEAVQAGQAASTPRVRVEGPKWVLDGTPIEQYSLQRAAYIGRPGWHGRSNFTEAQLREILRLALARPSQLALHAVGDAETARLLKLMEALAPAATWRDKRVRIEHGDGIGPDTLAQALRLGLVVVQNPTHLDSSPGGMKVLDQQMPLRTLVDAGLPLALGSDGGEQEQNPFLNLMLAVTFASQPAEALTREQALKAYTAGGAYAERQEGRKGRIAAGLAADLAVLSQDVLTVAPQRLPATTSLLTLVDGEVIFEDAALTGSAPAPAQAPTPTSTR